jgi:sugar lactone lactonase YvrE
MIDPSQERAETMEFLRESRADVEAGRTEPAVEALERLAKKHGLKRKNKPSYTVRMRPAMRRHLSIFVLLSIGALSSHAGPIVLVAGGDGPDGSPAATAKLGTPFGVAFDRSGNMFIVEYTGNRVRKVDTHGILTTVAGSGDRGNSGDGGQAKQASFNAMHSLAVARDGIYIADTQNHRIRRIDPTTGMISAFAGTGHAGFSGDGGPALQAAFGDVYCIALDSKEERMYLADLDNRRVRMIDLKTGTVGTVAGNGKRGVPKDGSLAVDAPLVDPRAIAIDAAGNLYILERGGHALRVVDDQGKIRTVCGTGKAGLTGDGGDARQATLNGPKHLCVDLDGNLVIADTENHVIRKYLPGTGMIVRVAGTGKKGSAGLGGDAMHAELNQPHGVYCDSNGKLFIADSSNNRVLRIDR